MSVTKKLAEYAVETTYDGLPPEVVETCHKILVDNCANMLAASQEPTGKITAEYIRTIGGHPNATVIGHDFRTHPFFASYANGVFGHLLDFEVQDLSHLGSPTLPALLALAEEQGLSGKDVVAAIAVAFEVQERMKLAITEAGIETGAFFHSPGQVGPFGSAAGCANLLGLTVEQTQNAFGIAGSKVGGLSANTGTMTKSTHCGNAARMGLESVLLAHFGFTANQHILEATRGYNDVVFNGALDLDIVVNDFGDPYRMVDPGLNFKKYPANGKLQWSIDAALNVREEHDIRPEEIKEVIIEVNEGRKLEVFKDIDNTYGIKLEKDSGLEGKFSDMYTVAAALLDGEVVIDTFHDERRFAPDMTEMLEKITIEKTLPSSDRPKDLSSRRSRVTVVTMDGNEYSNEVDWPRGTIKNPVGWDEYLDKFFTCATRAIPANDAQKLVEVLKDIESQDTIQPMMDLMAR